MPLALTRIVIFTSLASLCAAAQEPSGSDATLQTLLKEVHALRVALERSNQIGPKAQIALAKMQLQEERVRIATRQLQDAREGVLRAQTRAAEFGDRIKQLEAAQAQTADPKVRQELDREILGAKAETTQIGVMEQQFRAKEAEASSLLLAEQAKWNEINDALISIERILTPAQP